MSIRYIDRNELFSALYQQVLQMNVRLGSDVKRTIEAAAEKEQGYGHSVLSHVLENIRIADLKNRPMCQDTGMVLCFAEIGENVKLNDGTFEVVINKAVEKGYNDGCFRKSVVQDPLKDRTNTGNNLPVMIHYKLVSGERVKISLLAKGFGSENCSALHMLKPTEGRQAVIDAVIASVTKAGGSPCPPTVLGIGIGGTMDIAARLSKEALLRELDDVHPDPWYAELEDDILNAVNATGIGPGGLGGSVTSLGVKIQTAATHIAGMPVAVTVNCWADRKGVVEL